MAFPVRNDAPSDVLWRLNNEYHKRLSQAQTYLDLLEQLLMVQDDDHGFEIIEALQQARHELVILNEEHRNWRHHFYYDSLETRRMVQDNRSINKALARFSRMRSQHERRLYELYNLLAQLPRPDARMTRVPNGDLWVMTQYALNDLIVFGDYVSKLGVLN
jgi:phosphatidylserine/phosphatidylglycerophosphate/cardiolipin synthase-like enzyme